MVDYNPHETPNAQEWINASEQETLDAILEYHMEHGFTAQAMLTHAGAHNIVENQLAEYKDLYPIQETIDRLMSEGLDRHEAVHAIGAIIMSLMHEMVTGKMKKFPEKRYIKELKTLTKAVWYERFGPEDDDDFE